MYLAFLYLEKHLLIKLSEINMNWLKKSLIVVVALAFSSATAFAQSVTLGYQPIVGPFLSVIAEKKIEKATGYKIKWVKFSSGADSIKALASGSVKISVAGSSPAAAGISRGLDIELFYILDDIGAAEALVVRNGSGINAPQDLIGKKIGVPFVSTTHFHLLFALEQFGITSKQVTILNLQPPAIAASWARGDIDAGFVWDPALGQITKTGKVLITSGTLSSWGKATFDGILINKSWGSKNRKFVQTFIKVLDAANKEYINNPSDWSANSKQAKDISKLSGANVNDVPTILDKLHFLTVEEQVSDAWLGGGSNGGAAKALRFTSEFLKKEKKINKVLSNYGATVNSNFAQSVAK